MICFLIQLFILIFIAVNVYSDFMLIWECCKLELKKAENTAGSEINSEAYKCYDTTVDKLSGNFEDDDGYEADIEYELHSQDLIGNN